MVQTPGCSGSHEVCWQQPLIELDDAQQLGLDGVAPYASCMCLCEPEGPWQVRALSGEVTVRYVRGKEVLKSDLDIIT